VAGTGPKDYQLKELWLLLWQVPLHVFVLTVKVTGLAGAKMTFTLPFTCKAGPTMAAVLLLVPVAIPLWQSEQLKLDPECVE